MHRSIWLTACAACLVAAAVLTGCAPPKRVGTPLLQPRPAGPEGWRWVPTANVRVRLEGGGSAVKATFTKTGEERRLLALETLPGGRAAEAQALVLRCRLKLEQGTPPRLALVLFDRDGGAWYTLGRAVPAGEEFLEVRLPVARLKEAAFSQDADGKLTQDALTKVWIGLTLDGPARGTWELRDVAFTAEPYRPTQPLRVTGSGPGGWHSGQDSAVRSTLTTSAEGPGGKPCMKYEWTQPGHRHMYAIPLTPMAQDELAGYTALRFTYKASLPKGITHLFVALREANGAQYYTDETAPATADWKTITIPFAALKLGSWSKDANGRLDLEQVASVAIGCHGTAAEPTSKGVIWVTDIELVP